MISWSYAFRRIRIFCLSGISLAFQGTQRTAFRSACDTDLCRMRCENVLLLQDLGDSAGGDGAATLADGEPQALFHRDRSDELGGDGGVVARHAHLGALRQGDGPGHVGRAEVELGPVVRKERLVAAAL